MKGGQETLLGAALALVLVSTATVAADEYFRVGRERTGVDGSIEEAGTKLLWSKTGGNIYSTPAVAQGQVVFGTNYGWIVAADRSTGEWSWHYNTSASESILSSPVIANGNVYVGSQGDVVFSFDLESGQLRWKQGTGGDVTSSPAYQNGTVYIGSDGDFGSGKVLAINDSTGRIQWTYDALVDIQSSPVVVDNLVVVGRTKPIVLPGQVLALHRNNGTLAWRTNVTGGVVASPAYARGFIVAASTNGTVYGLAPDTGNITWRFQTNSGITGTPAIRGGTVYVASKGAGVYGLGLETGKVLWRSSADYAVFASPAVTEESVYVVDERQNLYRFNRSDGKRLWSKQLQDGHVVSPDFLPSSPTIDDGDLFVGTEEGSGGSGRKAVFGIALDAPAFGASMQVSPAQPKTGEDVRFTASITETWARRVESTSLTIAGGEYGSTPVVKSFDRPGDYRATLTVTDQYGRSAPASRVVHVENRAPSPSFEVQTEGLTVTVDASKASDPDGSISSYNWSWGDGSTSSGTTGSHTYAKPGTIEVTLTVADNHGASASTTKKVEVEEPGLVGAPTVGAVGIVLTGLVVAMVTRTGNRLER